jgi:hypothetical protein
MRQHKRDDQKRDDRTLRPVGFALAAVVAGLGVGKAQPVEARVHAPLEPSAQGHIYVVDPTNHPGFEEDAAMVVGRGEAVTPLRNAK